MGLSPNKPTHMLGVHKVHSPDAKDGTGDSAVLSIIKIRMKLNRRIVKLSQMNDIIDDDYVNASMKDRIEMVWEITSELWSLTKEGECDVKSRLQRDVANLTKPGC